MIKNPNDIVGKLTSDYLGIFGDALISVVMYGSAVTHEYIPGSSDINILLLVSDVSLQKLHKCIPVHKYWLRRGVVTPLILGRDFFLSTVHIYPIDYLHIQSNYRVLWGEDVFSTLEIQKDHLRVHCERELKEHSLQLRTCYLRAEGSRRVISDALVETVDKLLPLFKALIVLDGRKIPHSKSELISSVEDLFGLGASVLSDVYNGRRCSESDCINLYERLLSVVDLMADGVNRIMGYQPQSQL